jgi:uncharacterized Tic20 family protein
MSANVSYVGKPCPKCRYVRTATDSGADWQCPKCGIVYAKFLQAQSGEAPVAGRPATATRAAPASAAQGGGSTGLAMFTHLSILIGFIIPFFGIIVPIVVWITKSGQDDLAVANAKEAINFQISVLIWAAVLIGLAIFGAVLGPVIWVAAILGVVVVISSIVLPIVAAIKANGGDSYRYPWTAHIFS